MLYPSGLLKMLFADIYVFFYIFALNNTIYYTQLYTQWKRLLLQFLC